MLAICLGNEIQQASNSIKTFVDHLGPVSSGNKSSASIATRKTAKIKVHDCAFDLRPRIRDLRTPELWIDAINDLAQHDHYIRTHPPLADGYRLSGKKLYGLLHCGWVTSDEAQHNWRREDWLLMGEYESRLDGPYPIKVPRWLKKPSVEERDRIRVTRFNVMDESVPEWSIFSSEEKLPRLPTNRTRPMDKQLLVSS